MARHKENSIDVVNVRLVKEPSIYAADPIKTPEDVLNAVANELKQYDREVFAIINLKTSGQIINLNICSVGTLNSSLISPREVFKSSILSNAAAFIAMHNHPSGNTEPSSADIKLTRRVVESGIIIGIECLDHMIIGDDYLSMREHGLM